MPSIDELIGRIQSALAAAADFYLGFESQQISEMRKAGGDPVTEADLALDHLLRENLLDEGDGWLSEETADDASRLESDLTWIVDPLDGTREFIDGLPEYCTSVAAAIDGLPVAGGVLNPAAGTEVIGAVGRGVWCNGAPVDGVTGVGVLEEVTVLASRTEVGRGIWDLVEDAGLSIRAMGSVAYKLARVACSPYEMTWTPVPKHEWDVAGGAALLAAAGGRVVGMDGEELRFNRPNPLFDGVIAVPPSFDPHLPRILELANRQRRQG